MESLFGMKSLVDAVLVVLFYLLATGQMLHVLLLLTRNRKKSFIPVVAYEVLLFCHLALGCATANSAHSGYGLAVFRLRGIAVPVEALLWIDAAAFLLGVVIALHSRRRGMVPEVLLLFAATPPMVALLGAWVPLLFIFDASFFFFRTLSALAIDIKRGRTDVSRLSVVQALSVLPEGFICVDDKGRSVFMNDSMRSILTQLGYATDLSETKGLWKSLKRKAKKGPAPVNAVLDEGVRLQISAEEIRLFMLDDVILRRRKYRRMVALDVTEEEAVNAEIARVNRLLAVAHEELSESMHTVEDVAYGEAMLRMKARVHDTIGQRLSILHRYLEDGTNSGAQLVQIADLLASIVEDLDEAEAPDPAAELESIKEAFALVGVEVSVDGTLPSDASCAGALVRIIREAATNAVKHGQARHVRVTLQQGSSLLRIEDDGIGPSSAWALQAQGDTADQASDGSVEGVKEGTGFPSMRRAAAEIGATLRLTSVLPFTIEVEKPVSHDGEARDRSSRP